MSEIADRYRRVAAAFTERVAAVPKTSWERPAPCDGWVARDVVRHLTEWLPGFFFETWDLHAPSVPSVDKDPLAAWTVVDETIQAALDDPEIAGRERDMRMGHSTFEQTIDMICTADVLIHTWDLARATGLDETLDADEVHRMAAGIAPLDSILRESGQYGPRVDVPEGADEQTWLLGFLGRHP
jgi:uncharacterized protein (TIGR03086 family)